jgi:N-methylhydantoinase B
MTNTLNTPIEVLESRFPLRVTRYALRRGSGGAGRRAGGEGLVREIELLAPASVTLLGERRTRGPWGLAGGQPGVAGRALLNGVELPGKVALEVSPGDRLRVETPGGGGWGGDGLGESGPSLGWGDEEPQVLDPAAADSGGTIGGCPDRPG